MRYYSNINELPLEETEYFKFYHDRAFSAPKGAVNFYLILQELRLAYQKYSNKNRINSIAEVVKTALVKFPKDRRLADIQQALF